MSRKLNEDVTSSNHIRIQLALKFSDLIADKLTSSGVNRIEAENTAMFLFDTLVDGLEYRSDSEVEVVTRFLDLQIRTDIQ